MTPYRIETPRLPIREWHAGNASGERAAFERFVADSGMMRCGLCELHAVIDPDNHASQGVAERIGMRCIGRTTADRTGSWRPPVEVLVYEVRA